MKTVWWTILLAVLPGAARADCAAAVTQFELTQCAYDDWQAWDGQLNAAYKAAMGEMASIDTSLPAADRGAAAALREGQRAWITFRDRTCAAEAWAMKGGSAEPMVMYGCMAQLTEDRAGQLWRLAEGM